MNCCRLTYALRNISLSNTDGHNSDLVAFAAQDNSAAIQSPPILVPANVPNRRRRRREKNEIKRKDVNKNEATEVCIEPIFATYTSDEKGCDSLSSPVKNGIIGLTPDVVSTEDKHISKEQNRISKSKECEKTPRPSYRRIQERLKVSGAEVYTNY